MNHRDSISLKGPRGAKVSILPAAAQKKNLTAINSLHFPADFNSTVINFLAFLSIQVRCLFCSYTLTLTFYLLKVLITLSEVLHAFFLYKLSPAFVHCITNFSVCKICPHTAASPHKLMSWAVLRNKISQRSHVQAQTV